LPSAIEQQRQPSKSVGDVHVSGGLKAMLITATQAAPLAAQSTSQDTGGAF
jgi:hypothetical protein